jgi:ABC-2 type transport system permease protein
MFSLLQIEWMKVRRYRTFWILLGLFAIVLPLWNYEIAAGVLKIGPSNMNLLGSGYTFPAVWANLGWWGSLFVLFMAFLVITITCNEYSFRTHRQNIIDGWTRTQFFHAKFGLVIALSAGLTVFQYLLGIIFGVTMGGSFGDMASGIADLGYYFVLCLNYLSAALLVALLIRRSGLAITLFMVYSLFGELILLFTLNKITSSHVGEFLPLQSSDSLLPWPMLDSIRKMEGQSASAGIPDWAYLIASLVWIGIYYFAGRRLVTKRDL